MKKNNDTNEPREISEEEIAAAIASLGPIEVPEGPLTNSDQKCVIRTETYILDDSGRLKLKK